MKFSFYGHACFSVEIKGVTLLFDPFISPNELAKDIDITKIKADYIFLSHGHVDHVADAQAIATKNQSTIVGPYEVATWFGNKGHKKVRPMNHGGSWKFDFGSVKMTNAVHSSVMPDGAYGGHPAGYVISAESGSFYYAGDTALTMDMKLIPMFAKLDFAVLPIGDNFTMGVDDAVVASDFIECNKIVGVHFDTFGYIEIDKEQAKQKFADKGKELILLSIGETKDL